MARFDFPALQSESKKNKTEHSFHHYSLSKGDDRIYHLFQKVCKNSVYILMIIHLIRTDAHAYALCAEAKNVPNFMRVSE